MSNSASRFTQGEVTKLLKAARGTGFACVTIEVLGSGGLRAVYSAEAVKPAPNEWDVVFGAQPSRLQANEIQVDLERERHMARVIADAAGRGNTAAVDPIASEEEWTRTLRASRLSRREAMALAALYERRGREVPHTEIKGAGITTQRSLEARGYATLLMDGDRFVSWRITDKGEEYFLQSTGSPVPPSSSETR